VRLAILCVLAVIMITFGAGWAAISLDIIRVELMPPGAELFETGRGHAGPMHASGRLAWIDRYPWAARILDGFAPRMAIGLPAAMPATASAPAPRLGEVVAVDISRFVGLDGVSAGD
jgi:hypothetical protein